MSSESGIPADGPINSLWSQMQAMDVLLVGLT